MHGMMWHLLAAQQHARTGRRTQQRAVAAAAQRDALLADSLRCGPGCRLCQLAVPLSICNMTGYLIGLTTLR
jgi:hypothetical protein